jgi:hypothetical protein
LYCFPCIKLTITRHLEAAALLLDTTKHHGPLIQGIPRVFLHTLPWTLVRYCPTDLTVQERTGYLKLTFDEVDEKNKFVGGEFLYSRTYLLSELVLFSA